MSRETAAGLNVDLVDVDTLFAESDYITLHLALTPETDKILSARRSPKRAGRAHRELRAGEMIDQEALAEAMASGKVAGAALDVFKPEPPPEGFALYQLEIFLATPHIAGSTEEARRRPWVCRHRAAGGGLFEKRRGH